MPRRKTASHQELAAIAVAVLLEGVASAEAPPTPVEFTTESATWALSYRAPAECPTESEFRGAVEASLAGPPRDLAVTVDVERLTAAYRLGLRTVTPDQDGQRVLEDLDCRALVSTAASIVVWAVSTGPPRDLAPIPAANDSAEDPPSGAKSREAARKSANRSPGSELKAEAARTFWVLGAGPSAGLGVAPGATLGVQALLARIDQAYEVGLGAWASPPLSYSVRGDEAQFENVGLSVAPCARRPWGPRWAALGCAEVTADWIRASQTESNARNTALALSLGGGLGLEVRLGEAFFLRASSSLRTPLVRARLTEREGGLRHAWWNSPPLGGRFGLAATIAF